MLKINLIFLGILTNEGYEFRVQGFEKKVTSGTMIFLQRENRNGMYFLKGVVKRKMDAIGNEET